MTAMTLTCDMCGGSRTFDQREAEALIAALQHGDNEALRCLTCGTSLARPLQRVMTLPPHDHPFPAEDWTRRQHARFSFDLQASVRTPEVRVSEGRVKNLSDGGLLLLIPEIFPPSTPLWVELRTRQGGRTFEGEVRWNNAQRRANVPPIAHGIQFAGPVAQGLAVALLLED
ncbi:MAG TPA: PilZ domain-containing protein, partial [Candidatus Acidoferrum sp.]|nr:PilZ domain-containing protein [Candidatus Acidoferrum sp.]